MTVANGTFRFDKDKKRMHRFMVSMDEGEKIPVTGTLYIPKDAGGIPHRIVLLNPNHPESIEQE